MDPMTWLKIVTFTLALATVSIPFCGHAAYASIIKHDEIINKGKDLRLKHAYYPYRYQRRYDRRYTRRHYRHRYY
jgi:hypothetical protein